MSRLNELKKQYPELNISVFDMMTRIDTSDSYKYLPLFCKIFGKRFSIKNSYYDGDDKKAAEDFNQNLKLKGFNTDNLTPNQRYSLHYLTDFYPEDTFLVLKEFMEYVDNGLVENKDVTSYKNLEDVRAAVTLATIKELNKELEGQVIKEFEDDLWVIVRPLTFSASLKYGAGTRWCTTYQKEKNYFEKYWRRGILVYFINKKTGYKFAGYKGLNGDDELSFWSAEDQRTDFLGVDIDDYLFPIVKKIFKSEFTNKNLCSNEIQEQVHKECLEYYEEKSLGRLVPIVIPATGPEVLGPIDRLSEEIAEHIDNDIIDRLRNAGWEYERTVQELNQDIPTMRG